MSNLSAGSRSRELVVASAARTPDNVPMKAHLLPVVAASFLLALSPKLRADERDGKLKEPSSAGKAAANASAKAPAKGGAKNVTPDEVEKLLTQDPKPIVLDVRTPEEFADGHIAGATNVDAHDPDFAKKVAQLDHKRPVIVHCAAGGRSSRMLPAVTAQKFPEVYHMNKGFSAWSGAGKPVEKK
jgi:rhodanese-related sulfurtransferase